MKRDGEVLRRWQNVVRQRHERDGEQWKGRGTRGMIGYVYEGFMCVINMDGIYDII